MSTPLSTDTLSLVVEAISYAWQGERSRQNLSWAAESGSLEVVWTAEERHEGYVPLALEEVGQVDVYAEAVDTSTPYCWDGCNGITTEHRPGWCRLHAEHADLDCGCDESDYDWEDDAQAALDTAPLEATAFPVTEEEPF